MNIVIGTKSESKINALKKSLERLNIKDYNIIAVKAKSNVRENPIDEEIKRGAENRNNFIKEYCENNNIDYDVLISIEAGYTKENENYYLETFANAICKGQKYWSQSPKLKITKNIFGYVYEQNMLHEIINEILGREYINGFIGFVTKDEVKREDIDAYAMSQLLAECLNIEYKPEKIDYESCIANDRLELLDKAINEKSHD